MEKTHKGILNEIEQRLHKPMALPGGTWCVFCGEELCRNPTQHMNAQRLNVIVGRLSYQIVERDKLITQLFAIADALEVFKLKCYEKMNKGDKDYDDFIMNNAPCNYDLNKLKRELVEI